jgi:dsRNA-specific ribonuclease
MDLEEKVNDEDISRINGELVFNPYNDKNIEITLNDIQSILKKYGVNYTIHNIELFKRAFIQSDITIVDKPYDCLPLKTKSNERLEFIGDGILECITKYYLYRRFPKAEEGFMTEKKIALVKNEHIGKNCSC